MSTVCVPCPSDHVQPGITMEHLPQSLGMSPCSPPGPRCLTLHPLPVVPPKAVPVQLPLLTLASSSSPSAKPSLPRCPCIRFPPPSCQNAARGRNKTLLQNQARMGWDSQRRSESPTAHRKLLHSPDPGGKRQSLLILLASLPPAWPEDSDKVRAATDLGSRNQSLGRPWQALHFWTPNRKNGRAKVFSSTPRGPL